MTELKLVHTYISMGQVRQCAVRVKTVPQSDHGPNCNRVSVRYFCAVFGDAHVSRGIQHTSSSPPTHSIHVQAACTFRIEAYTATNLPRLARSLAAFVVKAVLHHEVLIILRMICRMS